MNTKKIILVTGATGAQGGSVAKHLLADQTFEVRCLTRNASSEKAKALKQAGADIVEGEMDNKESLMSAMKDCYGVFGVTNFWEHFGNEMQQGINLVEAASASGIDHFIYSSLPSYTKNSNGIYNVPHCDIKAELEAYCRKAKPDSSFVHVAFYYENFFNFFPPQKGEDGKYHFGFPQGNTKLAAVSIEDLGGVVLQLFKLPEVYKGKTVGVVGDDKDPAIYAEAMSKALNKQVVYDYIPREAYASFGFPGAEELAEMFDYQRIYIKERQQDMELSYQLFPEMKSFSVWVEDNKEAFTAILS